jgi:hypothetical protein
MSSDLSLSHVFSHEMDVIRFPKENLSVAVFYSDLTEDGVKQYGAV